MQTILHHMRGVWPRVTHGANCRKLCWDQLQLLIQRNCHYQGHFPVLNHSQECGLMTVSFTKSRQKFREYFSKNDEIWFVWYSHVFNFPCTTCQVFFKVQRFQQTSTSQEMHIFIRLHRISVGKHQFSGVIWNTITTCYFIIIHSHQYLVHVDIINICISKFISIQIFHIREQLVW